MLFRSLSLSTSLLLHSGSELFEESLLSTYCVLDVSVSTYCVLDVSSPQATNFLSYSQPRTRFQAAWYRVPEFFFALWLLHLTSKTRSSLKLKLDVWMKPAGEWASRTLLSLPVSSGAKAYIALLRLYMGAGI